MLEVACGTGRITLPIARDGVDVTGLDVSRPMIELARRKSAAERLNITWIEQDCRAMRFDGNFALVFSATNAMQHLHDLESVCAFLQSARCALAPGGKLILDVFNPDPAKLARTSAARYLHKTITLPGGEDIRVETASQYHADTQVPLRPFYLTTILSVTNKEHALLLSRGMLALPIQRPRSGNAFWHYDEV